MTVLLIQQLEDDSLTVAHLREELKKRGLKVGGLKAELRERLFLAINDEKENVQPSTANQTPRKSPRKAKVTPKKKEILKRDEPVMEPFKAAEDANELNKMIDSQLNEKQDLSTPEPADGLESDLCEQLIEEVDDLELSLSATSSTNAQDNDPDANEAELCEYLDAALIKETNGVELPSPRNSSLNRRILLTSMTGMLISAVLYYMCPLHVQNPSNEVEYAMVATCIMMMLGSLMLMSKVRRNRGDEHSLIYQESLNKLRSKRRDIVEFIDKMKAELHIANQRAMLGKNKSQWIKKQITIQRLLHNQKVFLEAIEYKIIHLEHKIIEKQVTATLQSCK